MNTSLNLTFLRRRPAATVILLALLLLALAAAVSSASAASIPTITIVSVERDQSVTIRTHNFPANHTFTARLGAMGTKGVDGVAVGTVDSDAGGSFDATFPIADSLKGSYQIAIRLEASGGYYSYNWFFNSTAVAPTGTPEGQPTSTPQPPSPSPSPTPLPIPTIDIIAVQRDTSVTIRTANFPAGEAFTVRMGAMGTRGVGGVVVATTDSGSGGTLEATYSIPEALKGSNQIAIRLESPAGYYSYNWFYNSTTQ